MRKAQPSPARRRAYRVLKDVLLGTASPAALLHDDTTRPLKSSDHDLATELVYGVLRWQKRLDCLLNGLSRTPTHRMDPPILLALRIGLYQLRFLSRIPARSAVNESVKLARAYGPRGAEGLVNAVLRAACRTQSLPSLPDKGTDPLQYLAVTLSHPEWLARRYLNRLGYDAAEALCRYNNRRPSVDLRVDPPLEVEKAREQLKREGVLADPFLPVPGCLRVRSGKPTKTSLYRSGKIFIQEAGSQLIPHLLAVEPGAAVLDACAAPGAKASEIAKWFRPAYVVGIDRRLPRARLMASLAKRLGCERLFPLVADAARGALRTRFPFILLDAPCSSLGTLARNPDIKWRLDASDLTRFAKLQCELLEACSELAATDGRIVYSTCSTEPEENEEVIAAFLEKHGNYRLAPPPESFPEPARRMIDADGALRIHPERDDMDGYFAAILGNKR